MYANRINRIQPSATLEMTAKAAELRAAGKDVINLSVGEPDFPTPKNICDAAIKIAKEVNNFSYVKLSLEGQLEIIKKACLNMFRQAFLYVIRLCVSLKLKIYRTFRILLVVS